MQIQTNGKVYISADGETFKPLSTIQEVELSCEKKNVPYFFNKECTITCDIEHFEYRVWLAILSGKKLFAKCPKKLRRSRKYRYLLNYFKFI